MRRTLFRFHYRFDASVVNSIALSISYVICHSVFSDNFKVSCESVFAKDLCISHDIAFLTIPCVSHDSIFQTIWCIGREFIDAVDSTRQLSLSFQWRFQGLRWLYFHWQFKDQPWHSFFDNSIRRPWLYFCYRFHPSTGFQWSLMISSSTVNQFSLTIYGSVVT